jgi:VanZ family protein
LEKGENPDNSKTVGRKLKHALSFLDLGILMSILSQDFKGKTVFMF